MEQLDLFDTTTNSIATKGTNKRNKKSKDTVATETKSQNIVEEESRPKELLSQPKPFDSIKGAVSWFTTKQYTWYCNTVERPERALRGLQSHLSVSDDKFDKLLANDKVMVGVVKGTYLIYFKK